MASWELLDEKGESELHKSRLLNVEEKPFKRITKRLSSISAIVSSAIQSDTASQNGGQTSSSAQLQEDLTFDFAAFDSSIARFQFLHDANERERERYEADKQRILAECQAARENNARLREQLEDAKATLARRKKFDELAEKILSNRLLRPREDQFAALEKLEEECKELERESETYSGTWKERRDQFNRIMEEGMLLRRQIRDEKEEVDRREGMNEGGEEEVEEQRGGQTPGIEPSNTGTPRPDGDGTLQETPQPAISVDGPTPSAGSPRPDRLQLLSTDAGTTSRLGSRASTRELSQPPLRDDDSGTETGEDVEMDDSRVERDEEEGEEDEDDDKSGARNDDKMEVDN
ncbi:tho complex subunit 7 domain-containing protein [Trichoderma breve]|uniref:Tho complex subunit 7 domain-containing protein n=1 Tax=Trichoderma breve TaxID=2034170 RepID=A0A9W9E4I4_9HYPO|nr:tho complex subunit 7 domain-containing protein [Trichoderma breve]KAJ4858783.1 tho complex subunit 7 domain-containing protein [Trichoderma breve]